MFGDPWVIRRHMVRHEIQNQPHAAPAELPSRGCQTLLAAKMGVDDVTPHRISRPYVILGTKIGECAPEIVQPNLVLIGDRDAGRTAFPDAHQPDRLKAKLCDGVPFGRWDGTQVDRAPDLRAN